MSEPAALDAAAIACIGLDWGSTHLRAYAFDGAGLVLAQRHGRDGALTLTTAAAFDAALSKLVGDWATASPAASLIACGMVGARSGWQEAAYVPCGAGVDELATAAAFVNTSLGRPLAIIPGMRSDEPDVMRGEETQLAGAGVRDGVVVLPGTHSKWVQVTDGRVQSFATFLTGEMNALLRDHSSIGKAANAAPELADAAAIDLGVNYAGGGAASWLHDLFVLRASVVTGQKSSPEISTVLAGWLLGCEFAAATAMYPDARRITLIASAALRPWYERIAVAFGLQCDAKDADQATATGLWQVAQRLR